MAEINREKWLASLPESQRNRVQQCVDAIVEFSEGDYDDFFGNCGLYAVGSSLEGKEKPGDIDIVLVGLDYRTVVKYNKIFLQDPEALIEHKIVIPADVARMLGTTSPFGMMPITKDGIKSPWSSLPERPDDPDNLDDLGMIDQFMLDGIEHGGRHWCYNVQKGMAGGQALSLNNYCLREGSSTPLVRKFHRDIAGERYGFGCDTHHWRLLTPFEPYFHPRDWFLTMSFRLHEEGCEAREEYKRDEKDCSCLPIEVIIHAENLHTVYWKQHQQGTNFDFAALYEWPDAGKLIAERPIITRLPHPEFIDPAGAERVKWHPYFAFLEPTPINAEYRVHRVE